MLCFACLCALHSHVKEFEARAVHESIHLEILPTCTQALHFHFVLAGASAVVAHVDLSEREAPHNGFFISAFQPKCEDQYGLIEHVEGNQQMEQMQERILFGATWLKVAIVKLPPCAAKRAPVETSSAHEARTESLGDMSGSAREEDKKLQNDQEEDMERMAKELAELKEAAEKETKTPAATQADQKKRETGTTAAASQRKKLIEPHSEVPPGPPGSVDAGP